MLSNLLIKNYALIKHLEMCPDKGLNIITGETGAGKSIMLGAIGLLMGNRADVKALFEKDQKCVIEGIFNLSGYDLSEYFDSENLDFSNECIVRREISISGKSRAFINDTPVTLDILRKISNQLIDIHSQHDSIMLGNNDFQLRVLDSFADNEAHLKSYKAAFQSYKSSASSHEELLKKSRQLRKEFDYNQFLFQELDKASLEDHNELEKLETELLILENAVEIKEKLAIAYDYLDHPENSVLESLKNSLQALNQVVRILPEYISLRDRGQSCLIELKDIADEINQAQQIVEHDQNRTEIVQERLNLLNLLLKKHQLNHLIELINIRDDLHNKLEEVVNLDDAISKSEQNVKKAEYKMLELAKLLTERRKKVVPAITKLLLDRLSDLGIPNAAIDIKINAIEPGPLGTESISFLFSGNKGIAPQELKNVASGGEFSRLMMVIKYILADKRKLPTIVFDEIDTGVSGEIAIKMGKMMLNMANNHQIIAITHLHQIASSGNAHYFVYKDHSSTKTVSNIKKLSQDERIHEIAHMIGGHNPSESILRNAKEMIIKN